MKNTLRRLSLLMVAMTLVFAGCEDAYAPEHDRGNNGEGGEPSTNVINGHEYVDLGLPSGLKWATCNVGANNPEDYGNYYAWGEITTKSSYTEDNSLTYGKDMSDISGNATYDAARANWGNRWRMPTKTEMEELVNNCTWTWTTQGSVNGCIVTGPNGRNIFLPATGSYDNGSANHFVGTDCQYWSSTPLYPESARHLYFDRDGCIDVDYSCRSYGLTVRPVSDPEE